MRIIGAWEAGFRVAAAPAREREVRRARYLWIALLLVVLSGFAAIDRGSAQTPVTPPGTAPPPPGTKPLSASERRALLQSVDEILQFASTDSGLPIRGTVQRRLVSRREVTRYLESRLREDEGAKRLERSELVLKKFGLLARDFDLKPFLLRLLTEQIAGYYDDKTKTVNLLDWVPAEEQRPVLAHELTHALQDQAVGLDRWSDGNAGRGSDGVARTAAEQAEAIGVDELETARSAVAEGQAMLVFTDYALRGSHRTLADSPEIVDRLLAADAGGNAGSPVLAEAPPVLRDSLLFPYTDGLAFEAALLRDGGRPRAFAEVLARPPGSSFEVMTPAVYLAKRPMPVLRSPDLNALLGAEWAPYDVGVVGALDVRTLAETYDSSVDAKALAAKWDGGVYYAAERVAGGTGAAAGGVRGARGTGSIGLVYLSRWSDAETAERFAAMYRAGLGRTYRSLMREKSDAAGDAQEKDSGEGEGGDAWFDTDEGKVLVSVVGRSVFVAEGFAREPTLRLKREVLAMNAESAETRRSGTAVTMRAHALTAGALTGALGDAHYTSVGSLLWGSRARVRNAAACVLRGRNYEVRVNER